MAVTHSLLYRRKQGRRRKLIDRYVQRTHPTEYDRSSDPLEWLLAKERKEQIRKAIKQMPKRDAEILLLKYTEDWSYRELAKHLGITESAVEARLHRARQRFRAELTSLAVIEVGTMSEEMDGINMESMERPREAGSTGWSMAS